MPERPPRKRRHLAQALDVWLAMWAAREDLTPGERRRVNEERQKRKRRAAVSACVVGFVGTDAGMSRQQRRAVRRALVGAKQAHHAGATQADGQFHRLCVQAGVPVVLHPPAGTRVRSDVYEGVLRSELANAGWDKVMVRASTMLVAAPKEGRVPTDQHGRGVWSTVGYARHRATPVQLILPNGQEGTNGQRAP